MLRRKSIQPVGGSIQPPKGGSGRLVGSRSSTRALRIDPALLLLLAARMASAAFNTIHDCDEVFNYWEPLHYLMYGYGLQTWEYSSAFALRSWWYLLLHAAVGAPVAFFAGDQRGKVAVFYAIRGALAVASALAEWALYRAVQRRYHGSAIPGAFLALLAGSSGMFAASAALLPSSFTMVALTAAAAGVLAGRPSGVIFAAAVGVVWGWCVAGVAFLPYALWVLAASHLLPAFGILFASLAATLGPLVVADRFFYGTWKASLWNFLVYNVAGGGQSALYGVESATYYLRNGLNQLQLVLPLGLALPAAAVVASALGVRRPAPGADFRLLVAVAPLYLWLAAITALPHKEERFLFVVYPLACLAAAAALDAGARVVARVSRGLARTVVVIAVLASITLSLARSVALVKNYGAPLAIYRAVPAVVDADGTPLPATVCVGAEWYRFPSAFFLPGPAHRLRFLKSGFNGLLPRDFDAAAGGPRAAPPQLNDQNREEPQNYWSSAEGCDYAVTLKLNGEWIDAAILGPEKDWDVVARAPFLVAAASPPLTRAFYIPGVSDKRNSWAEYVLLTRSEGELPDLRFIDDGFGDEDGDGGVGGAENGGSAERYYEDGDAAELPEYRVEDEEGERDEL